MPRQTDRIRVPILVGPTAVGKTELSISLALDLGAEIISADSRQIYRFLDIGTAKPTLRERSRVPHHLIDVRDPDEYYSAADFAREALALIRSLHARGRRFLLVGGSGLYLRALTRGLFDSPPRDSARRERLLREVGREGIAGLHRRLRVVDPASAGRLDPGDTQRIIRALEVWELTGQSISDLQRTRTTPPRDLDPLYLGLRRPRGELNRRIDQRVEGMIAAGLVDEVRGIMARGYSPTLNSLRTVGYREILSHLAGRFDLREAIRLIKRNSRQYAKRQMTWFAKEGGVEWTEIREGQAAVTVKDSIRERIEKFLGICRPSP
jgi:tRNA dimethylallyltransferase